MSNGRASCGSLASSAARQPGRLWIGSGLRLMSSRLAARIGRPSRQRLLGPTASAPGQTTRSLEEEDSNSHSRADIRNSPSLVKGIVVKGRRLHWLHGCTGSHEPVLCSGSVRMTRISGYSRFDPRRRPAADRRRSGGRHCLAIRRADRRASGGWCSGGPAGQRRPTGGPEAAGSARQSRTAVRRQRTRRDRGMNRSGHRDHRDRCDRHYRGYCRGRWTAVTAMLP